MRAENQILGSLYTNCWRCVIHSSSNIWVIINFSRLYISDVEQTCIVLIERGYSELVKKRDYAWVAVRLHSGIRNGEINWVNELNSIVAARPRTSLLCARAAIARESFHSLTLKSKFSARARDTLKNPISHSFFILAWIFYWIAHKLRISKTTNSSPVLFIMIVIVYWMSSYKIKEL